MQEIIKLYQENILNEERKIKQAERQINIFSFLRLAAIVLGFILIYQSIQFELIWLTELVFFLMVFLFGWLVSRQSRHEKHKNFLEKLKIVNENELQNIRTYQNIYSDGTGFQDDHHVYTSDLDIFGSGSLFQLINRCSTLIGNVKLASWLQSPAEAKIIRGRQEAVHEISQKGDWKNRFQVFLLIANKPGEDHISSLLKYLKTPSETLAEILKFYVKLSGWIFIPILIASYFFPVLLIAVIVIAIINLFILQVTQSKTEHAEFFISRAGKNLEGFATSFEIIEKENWDSALCRSLVDKLKDNHHHGISGQIKQLSILINRMNLGSVPLIGFVLKVTVLWNLKQFLSLERWKQNNHQNVENAFQVIADFEALISISTLKINYADYHFPEISDDRYYTLTAGSIGHPLIPASTRVLNDFTLQDDLKIDIITGSNMAGKSTFLRTLGINTVLALSGAPVCAQFMRVTPMTVFSYMRIRDSLNENTSTFKAELDRLQLLLEVLKREGKVFFLIDEMLRGTNSVDKYRGSKAVIEKLIAEKAVGIVATHDLQIAHLERDYPEYVRNFYFDIHLIDQEMQFDYKLKIGECKTFNASLLLRQLGIEVED